MREKVDPYLRPLYDALYDVLPPEKVERDLESGVIEIAPLAFMRGRTLANAYVILDEAQNTTSMQMKMFLTRLGENSKMAVTGDPSQIDLPFGMKSGLYREDAAVAWAARRLGRPVRWVSTRSEALPGIPAMAEFLPGYEATAWLGLVAPRNTPLDVVEKLHKEINVGLADPRIKGRFAELGLTVLAGSRDDFEKTIARDTEKWAKVVKFSGAKAE